MADTPPAPSSTPSTPPSSAADQARIRKAKREAKIRAGGSARLNKISGLGGGVQRDAPPQPSHADPEEVDISEHYYAPQPTRRNNGPVTPQQDGGMNDDALRQMMLGFDPASMPPPGANPFAGFPGMENMMGGMPSGGPDAEDPIMKMMQQMMGGMPGDGAAGMPSFPGMPGQAVDGGDPYAYLWRIVHAVFAITLGLYITFTTTFIGTKFERERIGLGFSSVDSDLLSPASVNFFWIFATIEVLLQSSRFFLEKGKPQHTGIMGMVMGFLPEPYKGWLTLGSRYFRIWTTVSGDALVCVFVLGVCAWYNGGVA